MDTLYDLLGALPRDDAEELRVAFRHAVKGTHPDLHPGDPEAGLLAYCENPPSGRRHSILLYEAMLVLSGTH